MFQIRESKAEQEKPPNKNDPESNEWFLDEKTMIMNDKKIEMISIAYLAIYSTNFSKLLKLERRHSNMTYFWFAL